MCLLVESIKIENKKIKNIEYHNQRFNSSRKELFDIVDHFDLREIIDLKNVDNTIYKCRVLYDDQLIFAEYLPYQMRNIKSLKIVYDDNIDYSYKYEDRTALNNLLKSKNDCDDVLIVKNNLIKEISFGNIAFFDGIWWVTPSEPLLKGTKRAYLVDNGVLKERDLSVGDLKIFKRASIINAMIDLDECSFPVSNIKM